MIKAKQDCNNSFVLTIDSSIDPTTCSGTSFPFNEEEAYRTYSPALRMEMGKVTVDSIREKVTEVRRRMMKREEFAKRKKEKEKKDNDLMAKKLHNIKCHIEVLKLKLSGGNE